MDNTVAMGYRARSARSVLGLCFFFSGFTGLLYEMVWLRQFGEVFGNTTYSISAVVAAFMGGLGLGGYFAGRWIEGKDEAPLYYGILEVLIGGYALALPSLLGLVERMYPWLYQTAGGAQGPLVVIKIIGAFLLLGAPTLCMGASLPLMTRFFTRLCNEGENYGGVVSRLYGLNTAGAVFGTLITGFIFVRALGVETTTRMGVVLNCGIGLLAVLQYFKIKGIQGPCTMAAPAPEGAAAGSGYAALVLGATCVAGFVAMLMEVTWTRTLVLVVGSSTYSFTIILTTFLLGIALGSWAAERVYRWVARRGGGRWTFALLGACLVGIGVSCAIGMPIVQRMIMLVADALPTTSKSPQLLFIMNFLVCADVLIVPALFFGAAFPIAVELYRLHSGKETASVGKVYGVNTIGAIAGSLLTGFALIPLLGLADTIRIGVIAALALGTLLVLAEPAAAMWRRAALAVVALLVALPIAMRPGLLPREMMIAGPYLYYAKNTGIPSHEYVRRKMQAWKILYYRDGVTATVAVVEEKLNRFLRVNGKTDASTMLDMSTQMYVAYLPALFHPAPENAAIIGFGSGVTAASALRAGVKRVTVIEIEPAVIEGAKYFESVNDGVWKDKRVHIVTEDARNYFLAHKEKYDIIISEPSNTWMAGVGNLFTVEHFQRTREHLKPGGIMAQWFHLYQTSPQLLEVVFSSFTSVYKNVSGFILMGDLVLLGSDQPIRLDATRFTERFYARGLDKWNGAEASYGRQPWLLVGAYALDTRCAENFSSPFRVNTNDRPFIEFQAPLDLFTEMTPIWNLLQQCRVEKPIEAMGLDPRKMTAKDYLDLAKSYLMQIGPANNDREREAIREALRLEPKSAAAWLELGESFGEAGNQIASANALEKSLVFNPSDEKTRRGLVGLYVSQQVFDAADRAMAPLLKANPVKDMDIMEQGIIEMGLDRRDEAAKYFQQVLNVSGEKGLRSNAFRLLATIAREKGNTQEAFSYVEGMLRENPRDPAAIFMYADIMLDSGKASAAERVLLMAPPIAKSDIRFGYLMNRVTRELETQRMQ